VSILSRRSPVRHPVSGYTTKRGRKVPNYHRGSGKATRRPSKVVGRKNLTFDEPHGFTINYQYSKKPGDGESVYVIAMDYPSAQDEGEEERVDSRVPISIDIIDPSIGEMLKVVGSKVKGTLKWGAPKLMKAGKAGARYAVKATMISARTLKNAGQSLAHVAKETGRLAVYEVEKKSIEKLVNQCYKGTKAQRIAARISLKNNYPEVFDLCSFSREKRITVPKLVYVKPKMVSQRVRI